MTSKLLSAERKIFFLILFSAVAFHGYPQQRASEKTAGVNFYDVQKRFYERQRVKENRAPYEEKFHDGEYEKFKRLEWFSEPRVYPTGYFNPGILWDEWTKYKANRLQNNSTRQTLTSNWTLIGPATLPSGGGAGRINCVELAPGNPNVIYVGAANGGLWKSINGGASWNTATDNILTLSIADIAIDPVNTNVLYIATGDGYGYVYQGDFWGGTYSAGILKSTDGGTTWNTTGFSFTQSQNKIIHRLVIDPANPQILFAATDSGLWKTSNGGTTWSAVISPDNIYDVEFKPMNSSRIYATADFGNVYYSSDGGNTWNMIAQFGFSPGKASLAVTPADSDYVYVWVDGVGLYKSVNGGALFTPVTDPASFASSYGYYSCVLNVSPTNANTVYAGGLKLAKSTNGGGTWSTVGDWQNMGNPDYLHADQHDIEFIPGNSNVIFSCNDGGIFKSLNAGITWMDLSSGLSIAQYYRLGGSASDASIIYAGQQDQGTAQRIGNSWNMISFGDGMETAVDPTNPDNVYYALQYGRLFSSIDGGLTSLEITPPTAGFGAWITPYEIHASNPFLMFGAWDEVMESPDGGWTWNALTSNLSSGGSYTVLAAAPSNSNAIYAGTNTALFSTTNGGASWNNISLGLPFANNVPSYIAVSGTDPMKLWITFIGYQSGNKVFKSVNGGATWTNVSGTLPNVPVNCIVYQNDSPDALYIGTDFGIFYRDNTMNDWAPFDTGLPNCIVSELEIHYGSQKIRAATYGRGLWESMLGFGVGVSEQSKPVSFYLYPNPSSGSFAVVANAAPGGLNSGKPSQIIITNQLGEKIYEREISSSKTEVNLSSQPNGIYFLQIRNGTEVRTEKLIITR